MANAVVWSKETCGFCTLAIAELKGRNYNVVVKKIIEPSTSSEEKESMFTKEDLLKVVPNARSVPQIFIEEKHSGGYTELMKHLASA